MFKYSVWMLNQHFCVGWWIGILVTFVVPSKPDAMQLYKQTNFFIERFKTPVNFRHVLLEWIGLSHFCPKMRYASLKTKVWMNFWPIRFSQVNYSVKLIGVWKRSIQSWFVCKVAYGRTWMPVCAFSLTRKNRASSLQNQKGQTLSLPFQVGHD